MFVKLNYLIENILAPRFNNGAKRVMMKGLLVLVGVVMMNLTSCQSLDDINGRLDRLEADVVDLKSALKALQSAYNQGKIIKSVTPITDAKAGGWLITFSDNSTIRLVNGIDGINGVTPTVEIIEGYWWINGVATGVKARAIDGQNGTNGVDGVTPTVEIIDGNWWINGQDTGVRAVGQDGINGIDGITPFLKIDQDGYWTISYDNGETFILLLDEEGDPIKAVGVDGKDGHDGQNGHDGKDGAEGLSIRLVINDAGFYVIQSYYQSDPTTVVNEIVTPYTADASRVISSMTQDDKTHAITMVLADGSTFTFNMFYVSPTSIAILNSNPIYLAKGTQASVEFRVNPSNALFKLTGDDRQIELDKVGTVLSRSSYVTTPTKYKLASVEQVYDGNTGEMKVGQYRAVLEDTKESNDYDEMVSLVLNVQDANGDNVQISSSAFEVKSIDFEKLPNTGLPIVIINTPNSDPIVSKETWMAGADMTILNPDLSPSYQGSLSIKGRGNSTWTSPKKPYALKLDKKEKVLGMPKHKRWCLLTNYFDRTLMRNAVAFEISRNTGLAWTPRGKFVELVLNGKHVGNYYLCEQIKVDKNRVNIAELDPAATEGEGITGGYIFEVDINWDEEYKFESAHDHLPYMFKDPDVVNQAQFDWAVNYVNEMEDALYDETKHANREFANYMDLESFVDYWIVNELVMSPEIGNPKSLYMYKDKNGKIHAGPAWDYDYHTFKPEYTSFFMGKQFVYYPRLFADPTFVSLVKTRWNTLKPVLETRIPVFINETMQQIAESDKINAPMWPSDATYRVGDEEMSLVDAVNRLKNAYLDKLHWLDTQIQSW